MNKVKSLSPERMLGSVKNSLVDIMLMNLKNKHRSNSVKKSKVINKPFVSKIKPKDC
jgi:hypothetical protein